MQQLNPVDPRYHSFLSLPNLTTPPPAVAGGETACIGLIPLFYEPYRNPANLVAFVRSAIYSRYSCLRFTDAVAENVEIKLLIEWSARDELSSLLQENFIDIDKDVVWFSALPLPDTMHGLWAYLTKKMVPYWFPTLTRYNFVVVWDADLVFMPASTPVPFFRKIKKTLPQTEIGYLRKYESPTWNWKQDLQDATQLGGIPIKTLIKSVGAEDFDPDPVIQYMGGISIYPAKHFHETRPDFVEWMRRRSPYIGHDEVCALFWSNLFDIPTYDVCERLGISWLEYQGALIGETAEMFHCTPVVGSEDYFFQTMREIAGGDHV